MWGTVLRAWWLSVSLSVVLSLVLSLPAPIRTATLFARLQPETPVESEDGAGMLHPDPYPAAPQAPGRRAS